MEMQHLPGTEGFASGRGFSVDRLFLLSPLGFATVCVGPAQYAILGNSGSVSYLDKQAGREGQRQGPRQSKDTKKGEVHLLAWRPLRSCHLGIVALPHKYVETVAFSSLSSFLEMWERERLDLEMELSPGTWMHPVPTCFSTITCVRGSGSRSPPPVRFPPPTPQQVVVRTEKRVERARVWLAKPTSFFSVTASGSLPSPQTKGAGCAAGLWALPRGTGLPKQEEAGGGCRPERGLTAGPRPA